MGFAPTTCPTTPWLENEFYPNPVTSAERLHRMGHPDAAAWHPSPERAEFAYQAMFRGPF